MRSTKLILIEGLSGSGKSTLAQYIDLQLTLHDIKHSWWYEETKHHPLYPFHDAEMVQHLLTALETDEQRHSAIEDIVQHWQRLADYLLTSDELIIFDGTLFGFLTWTLFPMNVPLEEIRSYLKRVEQIISPLNPCLIYLYQQDIITICQRLTRRGGTKEEDLIHTITTSKYAQSRNLEGIEGVLTYWREYRQFTDELFFHFPYAKLAIENTEDTWTVYEGKAMQLLDISPQPEMVLSDKKLDRFTGIYRFTRDGIEHTCQVQLENHCLYVDGIWWIWPHSRLIPLNSETFTISSFPINVLFITDAQKICQRMVIAGPDQLFCTVDCICERIDADSFKYGKE